MFLNQPISSKREEKTVLVCPTFIMKRQPFILEKRCSFLLADIGMFIDFLVLEKIKTKMCSVVSCRSSIFKKDEEKQSEKFDCPIHQIQTSKSTYILKGVLVKKGKLKSDVNIISDLIRNEKYVDNNIHIFHLLLALIWKILIGKYCEDSAWAECLKLYDKKKVQNGFVWFVRK